MTNYEAVIGLEIHAELATSTKLFCGCRNNPFAAVEPNIYTCPVCLALPGTLPVMSKEAVSASIQVGLALGCEIGWESKEDPTSPGDSLGVVKPSFTKWDRKNYFYPDLPKGYQISQYDLPLCHGGNLEVRGLNDEVRSIAITRIHLEEDTGKLVHPAGADYSLIDYNRAGVPLLELVTEPLIRTGAEAAAFGQAYQLVLRTLGVAHADMEKGMMRVEVNISVRPEGTSTFGTKVEVKNLNSFRSVQRAIEYEIERQTELVRRGELIQHETRGWDEVRQRTFTQRVKETAADYRYFPEPDLPPLRVGRVFDLTELQKQQPELPWERGERYIREGVDGKYVEELIRSPHLAAIFDSHAAKIQDTAKKNEIANVLVNGIFFKSESDFEIGDLVQLFEDFACGTVDLDTAKILKKGLEESGRPYAELLAEFQSNSGHNEQQILEAVREALKKNPAAIADFKAGKQQALGFLIGQVMRAGISGVTPKLVKEVLERELVE